MRDGDDDIIVRCLEHFAISVRIFNETNKASVSKDQRKKKKRYRPTKIRNHYDQMQVWMHSRKILTSFEQEKRICFPKDNFII